MDAVAGPYLASAALLVVAGAGKLLDPLPLVRALRASGLPAPRTAVRFGAVAEVVLGAAAILTGSALAAAGVATSYAAFTAFVLLALRRGGVLASCGCFGKADTPPTRTHVVVTGALAVVAAAVALRPVGGLASLVRDAPGAGLPLLVTTAAVVVTTYLVLGLLPALSPAARRPS